MAGLMHILRSESKNLQRHSRAFVVAAIALSLGIGTDAPAFGLVAGNPLDKECSTYRQQKAQSRGEEFRGLPVTLLNDSETDHLSTGVVSAHFFDLLGVKPILGRGFVEADDRPNAEPVLLLSNRYWLTKHHGDPNVVGKHFRVNDRVLTVVGVLPPIPQYSSEDDIYMTTMAWSVRPS